MTDIDIRIEGAKLTAVHELMELATFRCETSMLPLLCRVSEAFEKFERTVRYQGNKEELEAFVDAWKELKRKIQAIERRMEP